MATRWMGVWVGLACVSCLPAAPVRSQPFDADGVHLLRHVDFAALPGADTDVHDVTGYVSPSGREYVLLAMSSQVVVIDITMPVDPVLVDVVFHPVATKSDVATFGDVAYSVTHPTGLGVELIDLSAADAGQVTSLGTFTGTVMDRITTGRNVFVNAASERLYVVGGDLAEGGLVAIDVSTPTAPAFLGFYGGRALHDVDVVTVTSGANAGLELAAGAIGANGFVLLDVTNPLAMAGLALDVGYDDLTFCSQARLGANGETLYVMDERDEIQVPEVKETTSHIFDIRNPNAPIHTGTFSSGLAASDHNAALRGDVLFATHHAAGLRVFDVVDSATVTPVGHFDTYPNDDSPGTDGAFALFAGFPSGVVAVSDRTRGLFLLDPEVRAVSVFEARVGIAGEGQGVSMVDIDGDLDVDAYVTIGQAPNVLLRNDGGTLVVATPAALADAGDGRASAWADVDEDGDADGYLVNADGANRFFRNDGGTFVDVATGTFADAANGRQALWLDVDLDGDLDLFLTNFGAADRLFRNDAGTFVDVAEMWGVSDNGTSMGAALADVNGDGWMDLLVARFGQADRAYVHDGDRFLPNALPGTGGRSVGIAPGDLDTDGDADLYVTSLDGDVLLRNDGGAFVDVSAAAGITGGTGAGVTWTDLDRDGDPDVLIADRATGLRVLRNRGDGTFADVSGPNAPGATDAIAVAAADVDGDGAPDALVTDAAGGSALFGNTSAPPRSWLTVAPRGRVSNAPSVGARVRVVAEGRAQVRWIDAGHGYASQSPPHAAFGLGTATIADSILVRWPSGITWDTTGVAVDQLIRVTEPDATPVLPGTPSAVPGARGTRLVATVPNPFNPSTRIVYDVDPAAPVELAILDVSGRLVRRLAAGAHARGRYTASWNGRDERGRRVASGTYFLRMETPAHRLTRSLVLVK